jgi:aspartate/methionine/tyrosine aminotransferase
MKQRTIILDGFSKTYAMTGWRLGYGLMPEELAREVALLQVNSNSCTASFTQIAGVEALRGPQERAQEIVEEFERRRNAIVKGLNEIDGVSCLKPSGAFYVFPNVKSFGKSSREIADRLLNEGHVACLAGSDFGAHGEGYLRFSYANSLENIGEALRRMRATVKSL